MTPHPLNVKTTGSSPLARGLLTKVTDDHICHGIIPARAGFTRRHAGHRKLCGDHPRSRGVYPGTPGTCAPISGSSPLARGLRRRRSAGDGDRRIIPARVGFTPGHGLRRPRQGDHPRSRGVYATRPCGLSTTCGSSPLARGLPKAEVVRRMRAGIIPARAGFTRGHHDPGPGAQDHPRSRGVYAPPCLSWTGWPGSSPLARGLPDLTTIREHLRRDHPRSRGVYSPCARCMRGLSGSSPLARGLRFWSPHRGGVIRIIPARAGFTPCAPPATRATSDHPRSRGVYV